jgi:hypothetical protein
MGMPHGGSPSLHAILKDDSALSEGEPLLSYLLGLQHGDPGHPHQHYTTAGSPSSTSDHPNRPTVDCRAIGKHWDSP